MKIIRERHDALFFIGVFSHASLDRVMYVSMVFYDAFTTIVWKRLNILCFRPFSFFPHQDLVNQSLPNDFGLMKSLFSIQQWIQLPWIPLLQPKCAMLTSNIYNSINPNRFLLDFRQKMLVSLLVILSDRKKGQFIVCLDYNLYFCSYNII